MKINTTLLSRLLCIAGIAILILYFLLGELGYTKPFFLLPIGFCLTIIGATIAFIRIIKTIQTIKKLHDEQYK